MIDTICNLYSRLFKPAEPLQPGIYHFQAPADAPTPYRLHLRVEKNGDGILVVNASTVLHLNPSACEYAYHFIQGSSLKEVSRDISTRYQIDETQISKDYTNFQGRLESLIHTPDLDPVTFLDFDRKEIYSTELSAPLRIDCALTYQSSQGRLAGSTPVERVDRELVTSEWTAILDKAWAAGIPHVLFTGGEPTVRPDLVDLVTYTEKLGMVAGVLSDGLRFTDKDYRQRLLNAGLDYLMLVLDPDEEQSWEALRDTLAEDLAVTVHLTITPENKDQIRALIYKLSEMEVKSISLSASDAALKEDLQKASDLCAFLQLRLVWDISVPYSQMNPVNLAYEETAAAPQGAGKAWLYVEPDGDVLPGQGYLRKLGNILKDSWADIWQTAQTPEV